MRHAPALSLCVGSCVGAAIACAVGAARADRSERSADASPAEGAERGEPAQSSSDVTANVGLEASGYLDSNDVAVATPSVYGSVQSPLDGWSISGTYLIDVVSAASVDIVSTASARWQEVRHAGSLQGSYQIGDAGLLGSAAISREPDYLAIAAGGAISMDFAQKNVSTAIGYNYGYDVAGRRGTPFSEFARRVRSHSVTGSVQIILSPAAFVSFVGYTSFERGDPSKPYRYVPMFDDDVAATVPNGASADFVNANRLREKPLEQLPKERDRYSLTVSYAQRFSGSTLRLSERVYTDTWGLRASTTDARYVIDLGRRFSLWPVARFHLQTPVSFWERAYVATVNQDGSAELPALRTGDRELGPLRTISAGGGFRWGVGSQERPNDWALGLQVLGMRTTYTDTLFIDQRDAVFSAVTVDGSFD